ncbi:hypothetical protein [uncultured Alistipes sp.]|uniref:hypothetical protein n=1 Tax=uncultured Alistipes sp. TaxID=538949 RepID=UPI0025A96F8A|nr:hypothetical protein [uncultured Alistipes sp.]
MKKLFVSTLFISLSVVALAGSPTNTVAGDACRDSGVSVQKDADAVRVHTNANTDYNLRVTTGNGNSYEYDTRNNTNNRDHKYDSGTNASGTAEHYKFNGNVKDVDIKCYPR